MLQCKTSDTVREFHLSQGFGDISILWLITLKWNIDNTAAVIANLG